MKFKLNLNEVKYIINEVAKILTEITVQDAANKYYRDIPSDDFMEIVTAVQGGNTQLHYGTKWALELYRKKSPRFMEDLYKLHNENGNGYLDIFIRAKERHIISGQESDLGKYKSISELGAFIATLNTEQILGKTKGEMSNEINSAKNDITKLYEDEKWLVVTPNSYEASCYWGEGTEWCTASRSQSNWYKKYSREGILYINIDKTAFYEKDGKRYNKKYQFHFESEQFMDPYDSDINKPVLKTIGATDGLRDYYFKNVDPIWYYQMEYYLYNEDENFKIYNNEDYEYLIIDSYDGTPVISKWVESYEFDNGFIRFSVVENGRERWYFWNSKTYETSNRGFDVIGEFQDDVAYVQEKGKFNFIDDENNLIFDTWFDNCDDTFQGGEFDVVFLNGKKNIFKREDKKLLLDVWVDDACECYLDVIAELTLGDKVNILTNDEKLLLPEFVEDIMEQYVYNGEGWYVPFKQNGKWNFVDMYKHTLYSDVWFDEIIGLYDNRQTCGADVEIDGSEYFLNMDDDIITNIDTGEKRKVK